MGNQSDTHKLHDTLTECSHGLGIKWEISQIHVSCMIHLLSAVMVLVSSGKSIRTPKLHDTLLSAAMVLVSSGKSIRTPKLHDTLTECSHGLGIKWEINQNT